MKLTQTPSAPFVGALLITALLSIPSAWAKSNHPSHKTITKTSQTAPIRNTVAQGRLAGSAGAGITAGAIGAAALMLGGSHGSQTSDGIAPNAPAIQAVPTIKSTPESITTFGPATVHPVATRVTPYVTLQPPALVVTTPLHRRITTTSVVIPTPYTDSITVLQVHNVDRIINRTTDVAQAILPAHAVDRGIFSDGGDHTTAGASPEPASGIVLLTGVLGIGTLLLVRKRRAAAI